MCAAIRWSTNPLLRCTWALTHVVYPDTSCYTVHPARWWVRFVGSADKSATVEKVKTKNVLNSVPKVGAAPSQTHHGGP